MLREMDNTTQLFSSSYDYYKDRTFIRLLRDRRTILRNEGINGDSLLANTQLFYLACDFWWVEFKNAIWWREDLK